MPPLSNPLRTHLLRCACCLALYAPLAAPAEPVPPLPAVAVLPRGDAARALADAAVATAWAELRQGAPDAGRRHLRDAAAQLAALPEAARNGTATLLLRGAVHCALGDNEDARDALDRYLDRAPDDVAARYLLGRLYLRLGDPRAAIGTLEPALAPGGDAPSLLAALAAAYRAAGEDGAAIEVLARALPRAADDPSALAPPPAAVEPAGEAAVALCEAFAPDPQHARWRELAQQWRARDHAAALATTAALLADTPDDALLLTWRALALDAAGNAEAALAPLEQAQRVAPALLEPALQQALIEQRLGRTAAAFGRLQQLLAAHPQDLAVLDALARALAASGDVAASAQVWEEACRLDPQALAPRLRLVDAYLRLRFPERALAIADEAVARAPAHPGALAALAMSQHASGLPALAKGTLRRMRDAAGDSPDALLQVARYQRYLEAPEEAATTLRDALQQAPERADVLRAATEALLEAGQLAEAEERARQLQARAPDLVDAPRLLGTVLLQRDRPEEAAEVFEAALPRWRESAIVRGAAEGRLRTGRAADAVTLLEGWLAGHPADRPAIETLARAYAQAGDWSRAALALDYLLQQRPDDVALLCRLAEARLNAGAVADARSAAERAVRLAPRDPAALDTLGWVLVRQGQPALGLIHLREARALAAGDAQLAYHLGAALLRLDRVEEARPYLEQAVAARLSPPELEDARALLAGLEPRNGLLPFSAPTPDTLGVGSTPIGRP